MIIRYGTLITQASGTLGGITFSNRRGNPIASGKSIPAARNTEPQLLHQQALTRCAKAWAALTSTQRLIWALYASSHIRNNALGVARKLSPYQFYLMENAIRAETGLPLRTIPPSKGQVGIGTYQALAYTEGGPYVLQMTAPTADPSGYYLIYAARSCRTVSMGRKFTRLIGAYAAAPNLNVDFQPTFDTLLGPPFAGEQVWTVIRYLGNNSLMSPTAALQSTVS